MLHDNLCKITSQGAVIVFAIGAIVTLVMYLSATFYMAMSEPVTESTNRMSLLYERALSRASLLIMFACAAVGGLIMLYAMSWYMKKTNGPKLYVGLRAPPDIDNEEIVIEHVFENRQEPVTAPPIIPAQASPPTEPLMAQNLLTVPLSTDC